MKNRLVRFDWAMKKLLRNKANFEILEGFLSELIKQDVKIEKILESQNNKSDFDDKQNRVELLAETDIKELIFIKLQTEYQYDYFYRLAYEASKLTTYNIVSGFNYDKVKKAVSINIVYFDLGHDEDYIYKETTEFKGIHTVDQKNNIKDIEQLSDIFPEYYILKVNEFDNIVKNTLDEWIYFLKNSEIKSEFSAKGLKKAEEELNVLKLSKEDLAAYERYIDDWRVGESSIKTAFFEGRIDAVSKAKGKKEIKIAIAFEMLKDGEPEDKIRKYTGLTDNEIIELKKNHNE
ncbi:MAG: Rpn family recombination-promoting nuclease/putative transposase [Desulfamplus sp.]|nr:Rpn family recombination-promoting nuclease/putative transposase [Desulfamplus sp.]